MRKYNLTYEELIELAPKDRPFQIEVEFIDIAHPIPRIDKIISWAMYDIKRTAPFVVQDDYRLFNEDYTKKRYTLIDEYRNMYEKPEVLEVGTEVEILESINNCGDYRQSHEINIGKIGQICYIHDNDFGVNYDIDFQAEDKLVFTYPHYCVRPVERVEEKKEIITVNGKKYKLIKE